VQGLCSITEQPQNSAEIVQQQIPHHNHNHLVGHKAAVKRCSHPRHTRPILERAVQHPDYNLALIC